MQTETSYPFPVFETPQCAYYCRRSRFALRPLLLLVEFDDVCLMSRVGAGRFDATNQRIIEGNFRDSKLRCVTLDRAEAALPPVFSTTARTTRFANLNVRFAFPRHASHIKPIPVESIRY